MAVALPGRHLELRRLFGWLRIALVLGLIAFWFVALRPQMLGGPASYALVHGTSMQPGFHTNDIVIVHSHAHYHVGEVIAYRVPKGTAGAGAQVIHRIVGGNERTGFIVQGDNRTAPDVWHPTLKQVVGSEWLHIPKLGVLIILLHMPLFLASLAAGIAVAFALLHRSGGKEAAEETPALEAEPDPEPEPEAEPIAFEEHPAESPRAPPVALGPRRDLRPPLVLGLVAVACLVTWRCRRRRRRS